MILPHVPGPPVFTPIDPTPRLAVCATCEYHAEGKCRICGCGDTLARRAASPFSSCPLNRWPTE